MTAFNTKYHTVLLLPINSTKLDIFPVCSTFLNIPISSKRTKGEWYLGDIKTSFLVTPIIRGMVKLSTFDMWTEHLSETFDFEARIVLEKLLSDLAQYFSIRSVTEVSKVTQH